MKKIKKGECNSRFYRIYHGMRSRCNNKNGPVYYRYGGKGIRVEWKTYWDFKRDMYKPYLQHVKKHGKEDTSIDRIDGNKNYCKENCRWATMKEQNSNREDNRFIIYRGEKLVSMEIARRINMSHQAILHRMDRGLSPEEIMGGRQRRKPKDMPRYSEQQLKEKLEAHRIELLGKVMKCVPEEEIIITEPQGADYERQIEIAIQCGWNNCREEIITNLKALNK
jgi:hypothetical protein